MRGKRAPKRQIAPDPRYGNVAVAKFINFLMKGGKKTTAQDVVYGAFDIIKKKKDADPVEVFDKAIRNVSPTLEVIGRRIGGANYQIPIPVRSERRFGLASRWLLGVAAARSGRPMAQRLADELMSAAVGEGDAVKKKEDVHRMAEANKAFAHFARFRR